MFTKQGLVSLVALCGVLSQAQAQSQPDHGSAKQVAPHTNCTRTSLQAAVDSYLAAQKSGDRSRMAFADKVKYLENMSEVTPDKGAWNTAMKIAFSRSIYDTDRCRTFSEVIVTEGAEQHVIGTRLSVDGGRITAIDSLISHKGDWLFNANAYLRYSSREDWSAPPAQGRSSMQVLIKPVTATWTCSPTSS